MDKVWKGLSSLDPRDPGGFYKHAPNTLDYRTNTGLTTKLHSPPYSNDMLYSYKEFDKSQPSPQFASE